MSQGAPTRGTVDEVVMVPGVLCDEALWASQTEALGREGFRCTVADVTQAPTIDAMGASVLEQAPDRFHLMGLSMGGYVSLAITRQAPHRVVTMTLLGTTARPDTPEQIASRRGLLAWTGEGRFDLVVDALLLVFVGHQRLDDAVLVAAVRGMLARVGAEAFAVQQHAIMHRPDSRPALPAITCPTLVVCGEQDTPMPPPLSREIADLVPTAALVLLDDCGHLSTMERPQRVNDALLAFLQDVRGQRSGPPPRAFHQS